MGLNWTRGRAAVATCPVETVCMQRTWAAGFNQWKQAGTHRSCFRHFRTDSQVLLIAYKAKWHDSSLYLEPLEILWQGLFICSSLRPKTWLWNILPENQWLAFKLKFLTLLFAQLYLISSDFSFNSGYEFSYFKYIMSFAVLFSFIAVFMFSLFFVFFIVF